MESGFCWSVRKDYPRDARNFGLGLQVLGPVSRGPLAAHHGAHYVIGIGRSAARRSVAAIADSAGLIPATLVHPTATLGREVHVGKGSIVAGGAHVTTNIHVGQHAHIDRGSQIGHDSSVGDFATVHPMAVVSGNCHLGMGAELGTNCTLLPGVRIGEESIIGAGACVVRDVAPLSVVKGVPAR